jgi:transcriptional regulator with XRE-family HTH domain
MSAKQMKELRIVAGLSQTEMAGLMGLGKTAYVDLEGDDPDWKKFKHRHLLALERVSLQLAVQRGNIGFALPAVRRDALDLATMIRGAPPKLTLEIQELTGYGSQFLTIRPAETLPKPGERMEITVDHHAAMRKAGAVVRGVVDYVTDRGTNATVFLRDLDPPLRPSSLTED